MSLSDVRNGRFVYHDALFVEVGENRRHPRASATELQELLLTGGSGSSAIKDQVGHWYEAQLLHHGLPRSKDKNTAKVRLTNALSSNTLVVPATIRQIEVDLKKQYASVLRKAKAAATKDKSSSQPSPIGKKRKAEALDKLQDVKSSSTRISVKVGNVTIDIDQEDGVHNNASAKKQKKANSSVSSAKRPSKVKSIESTLPASKPPSKPTKSSTATSKPLSDVKVKHKVDGKLCYGPDATGINQWNCEPCRKLREQSFINSAAQRRSSSQYSVSTTSNHPRPKQTARRGKPFNGSLGHLPTTHTQSLHQWSSMSKDTNEFDHEPPPPYSRDDYNYESDASAQVGNNVVQISGSYTIILSDFGCTSLELHISRVRDQMWGTFEIGEHMETLSYLRVDGIDDLASGTRKSVGWRTDNRDTGRLRFGKGCDGWIEFDGLGGVQGRFHSIDNGRVIGFEGQLDQPFDNDSTEEREARVEELSSAWHEFTIRAYGNDR